LTGGTERLGPAKSLISPVVEVVVEHMLSADLPPCWYQTGMSGCRAHVGEECTSIPYSSGAPCHCLYCVTLRICKRYCLLAVSAICGWSMMYAEQTADGPAKSTVRLPLSQRCKPTSAANRVRSPELAGMLSMRFLKAERIGRLQQDLLDGWSSAEGANRILY
jgi:hypothetical protein